jgi:ribulose-phosphate 3-epimerase
MLDMVLVMTVEPGFGGQGFIESTLNKISALKEKIEKDKIICDIEVDGGINDKTAAKVKKAGANILVAGSYLFGADDIEKAVKSLL